MTSEFKKGDILLDKVVSSSRVVVLRKKGEGLECLFLDGYMKNKTVTIRNTHTYEKIGEVKKGDLYGRKEIDR
jgi:hypothetical protein